MYFDDSFIPFFSGKKVRDKHWCYWTEVMHLERWTQWTIRDSITRNCLRWESGKKNEVTAGLSGSGKYNMWALVRRSIFMSGMRSLLFFWDGYPALRVDRIQIEEWRTKATRSTENTSFWVVLCHQLLVKIFYYTLRSIWLALIYEDWSSSGYILTTDP